MSAQQPQHSKYGFSKTVSVSYEEAVAKTTAALKDEGFGVLCEIDIKEKLKEKLGVDFRRYTILGAVFYKSDFGSTLHGTLAPSVQKDVFAGSE